MKRGISPLIATVLIIGFTIILAGAIIQWGGSLFENIRQQSEEKALTKLTCVRDINFDIKQACDLKNSVLITIDNKGEIEIKGLIVRLIGDEVVVQKIDEGIDAFGARGISARMPIGMTNLKMVEVFPRIIIGEKEQTCESEIRNIDPGCGIKLPNVNIRNDWETENLIPVNSSSNSLPSELINQYNLNGLALQDGGSIISKEFKMPDGFTGLIVGSWVGPGSYSFGLDNGLTISGTAKSLAYIGSVRIPASGNVKLKVTGSGFVSVSELGLYQEEI